MSTSEMPLAEREEIRKVFELANTALSEQQANLEASQKPGSPLNKSAERLAYQILCTQLNRVLKPLGYESP